MAWARGHKNDWDFFAAEAADAGWNYESVLKYLPPSVDHEHVHPKRNVPVANIENERLEGGDLCLRSRPEDHC